MLRVSRRLEILQTWMTTSRSDCPIVRAELVAQWMSGYKSRKEFEAMTENERLALIESVMAANS